MSIEGADLAESAANTVSQVERGVVGEPEWRRSFERWLPVISKSRLKLHAVPVLYFVLLIGALVFRLTAGSDESDSRGFELLGNGALTAVGVIAAAWLWIALLKRRSRRLMSRSWRGGARLGMNLPSLTSGLREQSGWQASEEVVPDFYALVPTQTSLEFWGRVGEEAPRVVIAHVCISEIKIGVVKSNRTFAAILITVRGLAQPIPLVLFSAGLFRFTPMGSAELKQYVGLVLPVPLRDGE